MKIVSDTLQKPNGKFDKQALQMFTAFVVAIFFGAYIVFYDLLLMEKDLNSYAIVVEGYFIALAGGQAWLNMKNKVVDAEYSLDQALDNNKETLP